MIFEYIQRDEFESFCDAASIDRINEYQFYQQQERGKTEDSEDARGQSVLALAVRLERVAIVEYLMTKIVDLRRENISSSNERIAAIISKRHIDLDNEYRAGYNRLHVAVMDDEPKVIRYILERNLIDVNQSDAPIGTALQLAMLLKRLHCVKVFLEYNADVDFVNKHSQTPLHMAIEYDISPMIEGIFVFSKHIDRYIYMNMTVLQMAIVYGCNHLMKILTLSGSNVSREIQTEDDDHMTALVSKYSKKTAILPLSKSENCLTLYLKLNGDLGELLQSLNKENVNKSDGNGNTLLHLAATLQNSDLCRTLINEGADVNFYNNLGKNPLEEMLRTRRSMKHSIKKPVSVGTILIDEGCDVNIHSRDDNNILKDVLALNHEGFFISVVERAQVVDFNFIDFSSIVKRRWFFACKTLIHLMPDYLAIQSVNTETVLFFLQHAKLEDTKAFLKFCSETVLNEAMPLILQKLVEKNDPNSFETLMDIPITTANLFPNGQTLLTDLILKDETSYVSTLLSSVNRDLYMKAENISKQTPLHLAILQKNMSLIDILIMKRGNQDASIEEIKTFLESCPETVLNEAVPLILQKLVEKNDLNSFEKLMDIQMTTANLLPNGETLLTDLILKDKTSYVSTLLSSVNRDLYIKAQNISKQTPLHLSILQKNISLIDILIMEYSNWDDLDSNGCTVLGLLFQCFSDKSESVYVEKSAKLMIASGASPQQKDRNDIMAIDFCYDANMKSRILSYASKKNSKNEMECKICVTKSVDCVLDCGHVYCSDCSKRFKNCPICRMPIRSYKKIFF